MATTNNLDILTHLEIRLLTIATSTVTASATYNASGTLTASATYYNNNVQFVDREYIERPSDEFPFININDISDKYIQRICKNLYRKLLEIQIVGLVYDDRTITYTPQLGTTLQRFKDDVQVCLAGDTYFNASDLELQILTIDTEEGYVPPNASFVCAVFVQYYSVK